MPSKSPLRSPTASLTPFRRPKQPRIRNVARRRSGSTNSGEWRTILEHGGRKTTGLAALAPDEHVHQVAARTMLVKPKRSRAAVPRPVHEPFPIDVADMPARTRLHEPNGD